MRKIILSKAAFAFLIVFLAAFALGTSVGRNRHISEKLNIDMATHVLVYEKIRGSNYNHAVSITTLALRANLNTFDRLQNSFWFRVLGGGNLEKRGNLDRYTRIARDVIETEKTNHVVVMPLGR